MANEQTGSRYYKAIRLCTLLPALLCFAFSLSGCSHSTGTQGGSSAKNITGGPMPLPAEITLSQGWKLQDVTKVAEQGLDISQPGYTAQQWYDATVPGTVLTSLVNDGVYPEPLYGENNRPGRIPESLCRTSYWYRSEFQVPAEFARGHVWLNLHGINYIAEVWINGHDLGSVKGAFIRGIFDVTPYVAPGQTSAVAIEIFPPPHPGTPHEHTAAAGTGGNGGVLAGDGPTFLCTLGWDWIPAIRDRDMGLWQKVTLSTTGPVILADPMVSADLPLPRTDSADLTLVTTLRNVTEAPQSGVLHGHFGDVDFTFPATLAPSETKALKLTPAEVPQLHVLNPKLWWPNGYGQPNLNKLHLTFDIAGSPSDAKDLNFGIRKITYEVPNSKNLTISVNGVPVMCKGGDWGMDEAMKRIPRTRLETQIRYHQLANFNMIRNWVGQSTSDDFYDLCDQYGIMVWDEFFQPNKSDGPNPTDVDMYLANVRDKILRYRSHPSIVIWCGRNESDPAPEAVDVGIQKIAAELDPTRLCHRNSADGRGVRSGGPYRWREPREYYSFIEAFKTELGSVSIPTIETIHAMMPQKDWETVNDDWAEHDLCRGAQEGSRGRFKIPFYPDAIAQRYGPIANLPDFVRKAQLANYEAFRAMYEGRLAKLFKPCTGVLTWMSNPAQPSFVWQIYSCDLEAFSSLFAARKACEPVHIQMNQSNFHLMVINNTTTQLDDLVARVSVFNLDGTLKYSHDTKIVVAPPSSATDAGPIDWPTDLSPVHFVKLQLLAPYLAEISNNFYWRALPEHPGDFTTLDQMPTVYLNAKITRQDQDGKCLLNIELSNPSHNIALMTHLQLRRRSAGVRVLPTWYNDNYISLVPGETRTISVEAASSDLAGDEPMIDVDGWNVNVVPDTFDSPAGPASIEPNIDARVDSVPTGDWSVVQPATMPSSMPSTQPITISPTTGIFEAHTDIGDVQHPGDMVYDRAAGTYTITGNGENMWFATDAFHFAGKTMFSDDCALEADVQFAGQGKNPHRKACLIIRQNLDPASAYADVALHGVGLTSLQFRQDLDANTHEVQSNIDAPARLRIEKRGDRIYMFLAPKDKPMQFTGASIHLDIQPPYFIGVGVCSHEKDISETAIFSNVKLQTNLPPATTQPSLFSTLETITVASTDRRVTYAAPGHMEAPNWTLDGKTLIFNRDGHLWKIPIAGGEPEMIDTGSANRCDNDHVLSPDGKLLGISDHSAAPHQSIIYTVPIEGGPPTQIAKNAPSYLHGWSPDGKTLAFCGQRDGKFGIFTIPATGGDETRLTTADGLDDGLDFSPDGKFIYFNSDRTGLMQIWRMHADGSSPEQMTSDQANNWFAHLSPNGKWMVFLTYDKDVKGHPANEDVKLRLMSLPDGKITVLANLFGGQGTINVPSWSPDSLKLAFVSYQLMP
jgi:Tol biopolymer transport system component